jgi:hypothetical protein
MVAVEEVRTAMLFGRSMISVGEWKEGHAYDTPQWPAPCSSSHLLASHLGLFTLATLLNSHLAGLCQSGPQSLSEGSC